MIGLVLALTVPNITHAHNEEPKYTAFTTTLNPVNFEVPKVEPVVKTDVVRVLPTQADTGVLPSQAAGDTGGLVGSLGYAKAGGNCTNTARAHGKNQPGNPSSWQVTTRQPFIGAAALFTYNHVSIVVGMWDNGDLEVIHENFAGGQHRFPRSAFRGYF